MLTIVQPQYVKPSVEEQILTDRVHQALFAVDQLRLSHAPIAVKVMVNRVVLQGVVATARLKELALQAAQQVPGVAQVDDRLLTEPDLEIGIAQALADDSRTHTATIRVNATNDVVVLQGRGATPEIAQVAEAIAQEIAGVGKVINHLQVPA
jgi:osmotically-inducible protein OsmY